MANIEIVDRKHGRVIQTIYMGQKPYSVLDRKVSEIERYIDKSRRYVRIMLTEFDTPETLRPKGAAK